MLNVICPDFYSLFRFKVNELLLDVGTGEIVTLVKVGESCQRMTESLKGENNETGFQSVLLLLTEHISFLTFLLQLMGNPSIK